jgi:hypothetical protein
VPTYEGKVAPGSGLSIANANVDGTSFAAPAVSFVAALLRNYGLRPGDIKARILTSVDVRNSLTEITYSRGLLNPSKALAIWYDVLEYRKSNAADYKIAFGRVTNKAGLFKFCQSEIKLQELRKIAFDRRDSVAHPNMAHRWVSGTVGSPPEAMDRKDLCEVEASELDQKLDFVDAETGEKISVPISQIRDYIAAVK